MNERLHRELRFLQVVALPPLLFVGAAIFTGAVVYALITRRKEDPSCSEF